MPFQSEKQRRYLHANHPEIAKRWERDYANGGILDINESEEIISDDGNEIELTAYNAAFDEPNGVKSLFRAKDGGRIGFFTGMREQEQRQQERSTRGPRDDPDRGGPVQTVAPVHVSNEPPSERTFDPSRVSEPTVTTTTGDDDARSQYLANLTYPKRYKTVEIHTPHTDEIVTTQIRDYYDPLGHQKRAPKNEEEKSLLDKIAWGIGIYVTGGAILGYNVPKGVLTAQNILSKRGTINTALKAAQKIGLLDKKYTVDELFDEHVESFKKRKAKMDLYNSLPDGHPEKIALSIELEIGKKPEHLGDGDGDGEEGPIVDPITLEVDQEYAQGAIDPRDWMAEIRARQAIYQGLKSGWENQQLNSGGLANLFRVKNKY